MIREFQYKDFLPLSTLAHKKAASKTSISLVIPTFNEAANVASIITKARQELMENVCLLDEIVVMDSCSTDGTDIVAKEAGALVYNVNDVAIEHKVPLGKGSALWKSQFVVKGDIIICVDADIKNFGSQFIYGLIGPFFNDPEVVFAKAYYNRPLLLDHHSYDNYGGRVTEILVRPLLAAFMPDLAMLHQPLSGEYAFRRIPVQSIPFSSGYGVEIGMLFDIERIFGLDRVVQVDMGVRFHRNRTVLELGKMSLGILQTMIRKLEREKAISLHVPINQIMRTMTQYGIEETEIKEIEIPAFSAMQKIAKSEAL